MKVCRILSLTVALTLVTSGAWATSAIDVFPAGNAGKNFCDALNRIVTNAVIQGSVDPQLLELLQPATADVNGQIDYDPVNGDILNWVGNGMLDVSNELRLIERILKDTSYNLNGVTHNAVHAAWNANTTALQTQMGGTQFAQLEALVPGFVTIFLGLITLGDGGVTMGGPTATFAGSMGVAALLYKFLHDTDPLEFDQPQLNPSLYTSFPQLTAAGDADGDGCTNLQEYQASTPATCSTPLNQTGVYTDVALNPSVAPCSTGGEGEGEGQPNNLQLISQRSTYEAGERIELCVYAPAGSLVGNVTYQWRKNGSNIPGATQQCYVIESATESDSGTYDCVVTDESKGIFVVSPLVILVLPANSMPVGGVIALAGLAAACSLGGAMALRKRSA
jgi:hypothetical protein